MSYNYDLNPWDDDSNQGQNVRPQQASADSYSGAMGAYASSAPMSGYSNPAAQYASPAAESWDDPAQTMQYGGGDYNQAAPGYGAQDVNQQQPSSGDVSFSQQQQHQLQHQQPPPPPPPPADSGIKRFLRAHVPLCGPCMDVSSAICTPVLDTLLKYVNRDLLVSKIFYFFFYSAFGSLFPLMGVYFKQLGLNPAQVGILTGVRPFIEIFSAPFWSGLAERFQKGKLLLLFSLISWIVFTYSLAHIRPPASACVAFNDTDYVLYTPYSANDLSNYDIETMDQDQRHQESSSNNENEAPTKTISPSGDEEESEQERKDKVLAVEENQSVQGSRRRRKRRQTDAPFDVDSNPREQLDRPSRYAYSVLQTETDEADLSNQRVTNSWIDIDLENGFDDTLLASERTNKQTDEDDEKEASKRGQTAQQLDPLEGVNSFFGESIDRTGLDDGYSGLDDHANDNEFESTQQRKVLWRYKRTAADASSSSDYEPELSETEGERELAEKSAHGNNHKEKQKFEGDDDYNAISKGDAESETSEQSRAKPGGEKEHNHEENNSSAAEEEESHQKNKSQVEDTLSGGQKSTGANNKTKKIYRQRHKTPPTHIVGMSPINVQYAVNYNKEKHSKFVTPMFSTIVYKLDDIKEVFFLLLLLISLGEFFSAPAITIADSITLQYLGENTDHYGRQRTFGSIGWAITLLLVGMALDNSTFIAGHPCGPHQRERNYTVCFTIFSLLMGCTFITATQFNFYYSQKKTNAKGGSQTLVTSTVENDQIVTTTAGDQTTTNVDDFYASTRPREIFNTAPPVNAPPGEGGLTSLGTKEKFEFLDKWKSAMFAQRTRELPEWVNVFKQFFRHPMHLTYLFITWFLGCGVGLVFTFLFWHLQDVGGTPTLFGICSVINHISEILAYFFSSHFIKRFGHTRVLSVGLGCNVIRFLYVAFLSNPYYALPFELVQGITHAACFAACCSYMSHVSKPELRTSTQGVMQGLHHGIGRACGALMGGYMISVIGSRASFCIYGLLSGCVLGGFLYVRKKASMVEDGEVKVDDNEALGGYGVPQGVPSTIPGKMNPQPVPQQDIDYQW